MKKTINKLFYEDKLYLKYPKLSSDIYCVFKNNETKEDAYHTWLFAGGKDMCSSFEDIDITRTYINHFEEDIRGMWTHPKPEEFSNSQHLHNYFQRYIIEFSNHHKKIEDILESWNQIERLNPESFVYLVGPEDFLNPDYDGNNIKKYMENLIQLILKGLNLRNQKGYVFLQKHWSLKDDNKNKKIELFNNQIDKSIDYIYKLNPDYLKRIAVINHYLNTNNDKFKKTKLNANDNLNKYGHFEIGNQFTSLTYGKIKDKNKNFININWGGKQKINPNINSYKVSLNKKMQKTVLMYENEYISVNELKFKVKKYITKNKPKIESINKNNKIDLNVKLPEDVKNYKEFYYRIFFENDKYFLESKTKAKNNQFIIKNIETNNNYFLKIFTSNGMQFLTIYGNTSNSNASIKLLTDFNKQNLQEKIKAKKSITWLAIGNSITHAAAWTKGWNGVVQNFIRTLKEDYGRENDILINLAISGNTIVEELNNIEYRLKKYCPDILIIALGTNDVKNNQINEFEYENKINYLIESAKKINPNVCIFLSNILPSFGWMDDNKVNLFNKHLKKIANNKNSQFDSNLIIYADLNSKFKKILEERSYYYSKEKDLFYAKDGLHFSSEGQIFISKFWLDELGFDLNDSRLNYISHIPIIEKEYTLKNEIKILKINGKNYVDISEIKSLKNIGTIVIKAYDFLTNQIFTKTISSTNLENKILININNIKNIQIHAYKKDEPIRFVLKS